MRIRKAVIYHVEAVGIRPVLLELTTDEGIIGLGEAGIAYGVGNRAAAGMLRDMCGRFVLGRDPFAIERIWSDVYDNAFWTKGGGAIEFGALSAIEHALHDIKARALEVPVYELLGGRVRDELITYANGWYYSSNTETEILDAAAQTIEDGYRAIKFYPLSTIVPEDGTIRHPQRRDSEDPDAVRNAVRRVRELREAIGSDATLLLDLSGGYSIGDTIRFCSEVEQYNIGFIEEPVDPSDLPAVRHLARHTSIPLATGERVYSRYGFRDLLESRTMSILQPDLCNTGGIGEARKIANAAETYSVKVQPHICGSALATAIGMHFSATIPNFYIQEHFPYNHRTKGFVDVLADPLEPKVRNGVIPVLDAPGFGVSLDHKVLADHIAFDLSSKSQ